MKISYIKNLDFSKANGLIPAIIQDDETKAVLMLGYMNRDALKKTLETKKVTFYSRTTKRLWQKGETSGNYLKLISVRFDCDLDTLLLQVKPQGPVCHTGALNCFNSKDFGIYELFKLIKKRKRSLAASGDLIKQPVFQFLKKDLGSSPENSYTKKLLKAGTTKILSKIKEESAEVIKAAKQETRQRLIEESCDLLYHLLLLCSDKKIDLKDLEKELKKRNIPNSNE